MSPTGKHVKLWLNSLKLVLLVSLSLVSFLHNTRADHVSYQNANKGLVADGFKPSKNWLTKQIGNNNRAKVNFEHGTKTQINDKLQQNLTNLPQKTTTTIRSHGKSFKPPTAENMASKLTNISTSASSNSLGSHSFEQPIAQEMVDSFYVSGFTPGPLTRAALNLGLVPNQYVANSYPTGGQMYSSSLMQPNPINYLNPDQSPFVSYPNQHQEQQRHDRRQQDSVNDMLRGGSHNNEQQEDREDDSDTNSDDSSKRDSDGESSDANDAESASQTSTNRQSEQNDELSKRPILTNEQLMNLIDELKDFNSKESSKMSNSVQHNMAGSSAQAAGSGILLNNQDNLPIVLPGTIAIKKLITEVEPERVLNDDDDSKSKKDKDDDDDDNKKADDDKDRDRDDEDKESKDRDKDDRDGDEKEKKKVDQEKSASDDLTKFAKFLLTKDGANVRFQLGLDGDHHDDGDVDEEDDKDPLLESEKRQTKVRPGHDTASSKVNSKKEAEIRNELAKLIERAAKLRGPKEINRRSSDSFGEPVDRDPDFLRRKRDQQAAGATNHFKDGGRKWAYRSGLDGIMPGSSMQASNRRVQHSGDNKIEKKLDGEPIRADSIQDLKKSGHQKNGGLTKNVNFKITKEKEQKYPEESRRDDLGVMMQKLSAFRRESAKVRDKTTVPLEPLVRKALNGDFAMRIRQEPHEGDLILSSHKKGIMKFKVPKKIHSGKKKKIYFEEGPTSSQSSAPVPFQAEPDQRIAPIGVKSPSAGKSVKREKQSKSDLYPVSEQVSKRLNKLSMDLDRYFNDGFMQEIDHKTKLTVSPQERDLRRAAASQTKESSRAADNGKRAATKQDHDFDIDVSVDGKRDGDKDEDEDERRTDDLKTVHRHKRSKQRANSKASVSLGKRRPTKGRPKMKQKKQDRSKVDSFYSTNDNWDPVESEMLDTPIGPDDLAKRGKDKDNKKRH